MTAASPNRPDGAAQPQREDRADAREELPTWTELADAVYLAACRDAAAAAIGAPRPQEGQPADENRPPAEPPRAVPDRQPTGSRPEGTADKENRGPPPDTTGPVVGRLTGSTAQSTIPGQSGWPEGGSLTDSLALSRSMRPLRLTSVSPFDVELDEEATADQAAEEELWTPVCVPVPERRLDLLLLVDESPSMALWWQTAHRIHELMEQTAAFRTVRTVRWNPDDSPARANSAATVRPGDRQLILVVTDGGGDAWRTGTAAALLHLLARSSPTAVLTVLPQHLWDLTLPTVRPTRMRATTSAAANRFYGTDLAEGCTPVPVVELRPASLERWARLVAAEGASEWHTLPTLLTGADGDLRVDPVNLVTSLPELLSAEGAMDIVRRFRATASPDAYALAQQLAAVPLNLPVMRLLQQSLPRTERWHLAEIMLLGLIRRTDPAADAEDAHRVSFDFAAGVREELLALGSRSQTIRTLRRVHDFLGPRFDALWEGGSALVAPDGNATALPLTEQTRPFVVHLYTALCALSGPYLAHADRLGRILRNNPSAPSALMSGDAGTSPRKGSSGKFGGSAGKPRAKKPVRKSSSRSRVAKSTTGSHSSGQRATPSRFSEHSAFPPSAPALPLQGGPVVSTGSPLAPAPEGPPRIWGNVPQRNRNFTGRLGLLEQLQERLGRGVTAVLPEALHGMGGVGKSQIAIEYVYRHNRDYRLIWWIPAEQENQIVQSLIELGEQMGLQSGSRISAVPAVLDALRRGDPYGDWLLVFDNAEDPKQVRKYFPSDGPGRILVTSRNHQWSSTASSLEVDVFAREESVALLRRRSPQLPDEAVDHLAAALGDLPLAVEQAAVWLAETGMPVQQYLELFERKWAELLQSEPPPDYEMPVAAAWNVSLERLREDQPDALQLLQVCAFFAPEPISWELFSAVRGISVPQALQSVLDDPVKLGRAVRGIGRYALARIDHRQSTIQLHRLVQRVLVEQMDEGEQDQMRHAAHQLLSYADPMNPQRAAFWSRYSSLLPHLLASEAVECSEAWTRRLVLNEVRFLRARGDYAAALAMGEHTSGIWRERLGEDHEEALALDQQIAEILREQNTDLDRAYRLQSELVDRYRATMGEAHEGTLQAQSFMATHHRTRGDFHLARELDHRVYETSLREFGPDDPATLLAAHNYAVSVRLAGDSQEAKELDYDTWQRRVEVLGDDHLFTMTTYQAYLVDLLELGHFKEALERYQQLVDEAARILGESHWFTFQANRNLCVALRKQGNHDEAFKHSLRYMPLTANRFGENSRRYLQMATTHANILRQIGRFEESRALHEELLQRHRMQYGPDHPHTYGIAMNLAVTLRLVGEHEAALALDRDSVEGLGTKLGDAHPRTLLARMNLASDLFALGHPDQAYEIDSAVAELTARLRENHPANLAVRLNLSYDLKALRRVEDAQRAFRKALEAYEEDLGPSHPATQDAAKGLRANADIDLISL